MGSPILIMGEVWGSNLSERGCPIAQKAHYQVPQHFSQCLRALFHAFCAFPILLKRYRDLRRAVIGYPLKSLQQDGRRNEADEMRRDVSTGLVHS